MLNTNNTNLELINTLLDLYGETATIATDEEIHMGIDCNKVATPLTIKIATDEEIRKGTDCNNVKRPYTLLDGLDAYIIIYRNILKCL